MKSKIFMSATKRSIMDIVSNLQYHEEKTNAVGKVTEDLYKGNLIFSITEKGTGGKAVWENGRKKYLSSFMNKETAKMVFDSILNDRFVERFGNGGIKYNSPLDTNKDKRLRIMATKLIPIINVDTKRLTHFIFVIEEGFGKREQNKIVMDGASEVTVEHWVSYTEAIKMALEVLDYIRAEEIKAMIQGKPLCTISYGIEGKYPVDEIGQQEPVAQPAKREIPLGEKVLRQSMEYDDEKLGALDHEQLQKLLIRTENADSDELKELYKRALKEAKKRMGKVL